MNKQRRRAIVGLQDNLNSAKFLLEAVSGKDASDIAMAVAVVKDGIITPDDIEELMGEEQDYLDNMPEALQSSERGEQAQAAIDNLGEAKERVGTATECLEGFDSARDADDWLQELIDELDEAIGSLMEAQS